MESIFHVNPQLDIPIYQQLVDSIRVAIKRGALVYGEKLPTVQEISEELSIARGTIKRAYDELEREGLIEKGQGRGTFVKYRPTNIGSRKEQAMNAIDSLLDQLEGMGFTSTEISIFLDLKLRERSEHERQIKVAVVECNPENLSQMTEHLRKIQQIDLYAYLLDNIQQYPYIVNEDVDLVVTTATHAEYLESILPADKRIIRVALRLRQNCFSEILRLRKGKRVGILSSSLRFGQLLYNTCQSYTEGLDLSSPEVFTQELDVDSYLSDKDVVLVPKYYEKQCTEKTADALHGFAKKGKMIVCSYELDEGSFLYLDIKIKRMLEEKS